MKFFLLVLLTLNCVTTYAATDIYFTCNGGNASIYVNAGGNSIRSFPAMGYSDKDRFDTCNFYASRLTQTFHSNNLNMNSDIYFTCNGGNASIYVNAGGNSIRSFPAMGYSDKDRFDTCNFYASRLTQTFHSMKSKNL